ncbi:MAG: pyridoxal 5'-phosphate synthase glutaminase subunit PdxT, partial [Calditrichia bacterium]
EIINNTIQPLKLIDISIERNAYGRQRESFVSNIKLNLNGTERNFEGVFIRAPKITRIGKEVRPLGYLGDNIVIAESKNILISTFHPELAGNEDDLIHRYFIDKVRSLKRK